VDVRAGYGTVYHCRIKRYEPGRALELVVRPAGLLIVNVYEVEPAPTGARVRHAFEVSGPIASVARVGLARIYQRQLEAEVDDVIRMARGDLEPGEPAGPERVSRPEHIWHRVGKAMRGGRERQAP